MATPDGTSAPIIGRPVNRKLIYVDGYWYLFYYGTDDFCYSSSTDADATHTTFGSEVELAFGTIASINDINVVTDGQYIHVAYLKSTTLYYRRGSVSAGVISWSSEQTVTTGVSRANCIAITTDSHVIISHTSSSHAYVSKNDNTTSSSTWTNASGFPKQFSVTSNSGIYTTIMPLASGKIYCVWCRASAAHVYGREWTGSAFVPASSEDQISDYVAADANGFSAYSDSTGRVYTIWECNTGSYYYSRCRRRLAAGTFDSAVNVGGGNGVGGDNVMPCLTVNQSTGDVIAFYKHYSNQHLLTRYYTNSTSTWETEVDKGAQDDANDDGYINCTATTFNGYAVCGLGVKTTSPYEVHTISVVSATGGGTSYLYINDTITLTDETSKSVTGNITGPWTVGASTSAWPLGNVFAPKCFYAKGRIWVFYSCGVNCGYRSSVSGEVWTNFVAMFPSTEARAIVVCFDGQYIHLVRGWNTAILLYNRGVPNSNGSITWAGERTISQGGTECRVMSICIDSANRPVLCFYRDQDIYIAMNTGSDGNWINGGGYPVKVNSTASAYIVGAVVPYGETGWYVAYCANVGSQLYGRLWDGTTMGIEETVSTVATGQMEKFSLASFGTEIRASWATNESSVYNIYTRRRYNGNWLSAQKINTDVPGVNMVPATSMNLYDKSSLVAYCRANHIYYRKQDYSTQVWATVVDWTTESGLLDKHLNITRDVHNGYIIIAYYNGTNIRLGLLSSAIPPKTGIAKLKFTTGAILDSGPFIV